MLVRYITCFLKFISHFQEIGSKPFSFIASKLFKKRLKKHSFSLLGNNEFLFYDTFKWTYRIPLLCVF